MTQTDMTKTDASQEGVLAVTAADAEVVVGVHDPMHLKLGADAIHHARDSVGHFDGPVAEWEDSLHDLEAVLVDAYKHRQADDHHVFRVHPHDVWLTAAALGLFRTERLADLFTDAYAADADAAAEAWRQAYDSIQGAPPEGLPSTETARGAVRDVLTIPSADLTEALARREANE